MVRRYPRIPGSVLHDPNTALTHPGHGCRSLGGQARHVGAGTTAQKGSSMRTSPIAGFLAGTALASALVGGAAWAASSPTPAPTGAASSGASTAAPSTAAPSTGATSTGTTRGAGAKAGRRALGARAVHGRFTLTTGKGPRTVLVQRGAVSAVTQPSGTTPGRVTVVSADKFSATYTLPRAAKVRLAPAKGATTPAAATTVKVGERVRLVARADTEGGVASLTGVRVLPARAGS